MNAALAIIAVALISAGGLHAAIEAAITVLPVAEIQSLAERHPQRAKALRRIAEQPVEHANTASFLRVFSETAAAVCVAILLVRWLDNPWLALLLAVAIMTLASYVLVGASPRSVGRNRPERILTLGARLIVAARVTIGPLAVSLSSFGRRVRQAGAPTEHDEETRLLHLVDKAVEQEVLEQGERRLIHQVVEFGDTLTRSIMVPRVDMRTIDSTTSLEAAMQVFLDSGFSRLPVRDEHLDDVTGVVYLRDVAGRLLSESRDDAPAAATTVAQLAQRPNLVPESKPIDDLLQLMRRTRRHMWIVVDEYGSVAGLVTLEDVIEELVGEISDEHDRSTPEFTNLGKGRYRVSARLGVDELGELFDLDLDDDEVDTVGGLFVKTLGHLPTLQERVRVHGLLLTAARIDAKSGRLLTLIAERAPRSETSEESA